ncbi:acyl carrier protein [Nonomuraea sp. NBC_01738]|uniref:acyl carrier protein n=1 Tax=Nonomuraea sp. NBC_01738 TaxID=2976003 RepID=UPI002E137585|nr:acyl carrier protein [Nonomuraea sp. NBC_01738]
MHDDVRQKVRGFVAPHFGGRDLADDEDIFALGFVDSLFAMEMVMFIERTFAVTISNDLLLIDNFRTVDRMVGLVARLSGPQEVASA